MQNTIQKTPRLNTRFQVQGADRECLLTAATARGQTVGQAARDLALAYLRGAQSAETQLRATVEAMARELSAVRTELAAMRSRLN